MKLIYKLLVFLGLYIVPATLIIMRHSNIQQRTKINPLVFIGVGVIFFLYAKEKNKRMKIIEAKEIEDRARTSRTKLYFTIKFFIVFALVYLALNYISFNFDSITLTMELMALSFVIGRIADIRLAQEYGL